MRPARMYALSLSTQGKTGFKIVILIVLVLVVVVRGLFWLTVDNDDEDKQDTSPEAQGLP